MNADHMLGFLWLLALFTCTREVPLDQPIEGQKDSNKTSDFSEDIDWDAFKDSRDKQYDGSDSQENSAHRGNHSRMLLKTSTTLNYDDWWFFTTRRPILSYKDFPGKPGVATWKEISPASSDNRKSRKINPTAAGISSSSWRLLSDVQNTISFSFIGIIFFLHNFLYS
ncbi:uncharacterized protein NPIL_115351 [Nephila pilipes]|uniref:Uncharacterized protein n=1 Tax=Nephila pilipes TaxID=299642 RepID=A0A8X6P8E1_NEPPI|nr:uncharacterized protein NPIL_115351 [Nephila pilipes]